MSIDWTNAEAANGLKLVEFIEARTGRPLRGCRTYWAWRNGVQAMFASADRVLCEHDLHPSEVPDDVWEKRRHGIAGNGEAVPRGKSVRRKLTADQVRAIRASDDATNALARLYGVDRKSIQKVRQGKTYTDIRAAA